MRHRISGNRLNMASPRRRSAIRNMIDGLFIWEHITTTEARAKVVRGEAEKLITIALRGHDKAWKYLLSVVPDQETADQVLAIARKGRFRLDESTSTNLVEVNEEREARGQYPLHENGLRARSERTERLQKELLGVIKDPDEAQKALDAARRAMALELHARRIILSRLPHETTVKKIFDIYVPRYQSRPGGYTRIFKIGYRKGDASEMARLEMVQE